MRHLVLLIATNSLFLSAGMLELPLFFSYATAHSVFSPPHSHWGSVMGDPIVFLSRLSGNPSGFGSYSGMNQDDADMPDLSQEPDLSGCLPLPTEVLATMSGNHPDPHQAIMFLLVNEIVPSINTGISEHHETGVFPLSCEQDACVAWDYDGRINVLELSEAFLCAEPAARKTKARIPWTVAQSVDQDGNIIYQWYDEDGHLHSIGEWEYKRQLSMYFQSWLEFLYPEFFGLPIPAGGGWHQWQYRKVRRTSDRPKNTGQQGWPARQTRQSPNGKTERPVAIVQPARLTKYQLRDQNGRPQPSPSGGGTRRAVENDIDTLLEEFESGYMQRVAAKHNKSYDGKKHGQYCSKIKNVTKTRRKPLTDEEKLRFVPFMRHLSEVVYSFNGISLSTCVHSLVASQLLYPPRFTQGQRTALSGEGGSVKVKEVQKALTEELLTAVASLAQLQNRTPYGFDAQAISNLLWALAKLVENGLLQLDQGGLASQAVTALLPQVVTPPEPLKPQDISNLLWALAKLVENGLLQLDQGGLASQAVMALLPQVQSHQDDFTSQGISNLLWALAKLVENGLLQLDQGGLASQAVTALLPQVVTPPGPFKPQEISNLLWALAKLVENGLLQLDQGSLASQAVTALLPQVVTPPGPFISQHVSNLLWALAKLVENGLLQLDQGGLASQAVTALLPQVVTPPEPFISQHVSNLLWALAKLVENGLLQLDQGGLASQAVTALLPQVVTPPGPFKPQESPTCCGRWRNWWRAGSGTAAAGSGQGISNLLWAL